MTVGPQEDGNVVTFLKEDDGSLEVRRRAVSTESPEVDGRLADDDGPS